MQYVVNQLKDQKSYDLLLIADIIKSMSVRFCPSFFIIYISSWLKHVSEVLRSRARFLYGF